MLTIALFACNLRCDANRVASTARDFAGSDAIACNDAMCVMDAHTSGVGALFEAEPVVGIDSVLRSWIVTGDEGMWFFNFDPLGSAGALHCLDPFPSGQGFECTSREYYAVCGGGSSVPPLRDR